MYTVISIIIVLVLAIGGYFAFSNNYAKNSSGDSNNSNTNNNAIPAGTVVISQEVFDPGTITISKGDMVTWQNKDSIDHTVVADDGSFDLGTVAGGKSVKHTFDQTGTFKYHCSIHTFMTGSVVVK